MQPPTKAIPPVRDRLQSRLLVLGMLPVICWTDVLAIHYAFTAGHRGHVYLTLSIAISVFFGLFAWRLKAATPGASILGAMICMAITVLSGRPEGPSPFHSGLAPLILLFVLIHEATRLGHDRKKSIDIEEARSGRNAAQIIANLGIAAVPNAFHMSMFGIGLHHGLLWSYILATFSVPMLAVLGEATADTVSSEIGKAFGGTPVMLTNFRPILTGTDGAISLIGTCAGIAGAAVVVLIGIPALGMDMGGCAIAFVAAIAGLLFDSLLGATIERKGWIGNDLVNFFSTAFAGILALAMQIAMGQFNIA